MTRIAALLAALLISTPLQAAPALWQASDADSSIWLFGSIHMLPDGTEWRTPAFDAILADADKVVLETDLSPEQQALLGAEAFVRGIYVDGSLLTDVLDDEAEALLRSAAAAVGQPVGSLIAMRPWMAANTISVAAMMSAGYSLEGVELQLLPELSRERQVFLETGAQQLDVLSTAPDDEQVATLVATLEQLHTMPKLLYKMLDSWLDGRPERLSDLFMMEMGGFEDAFFERLLYARNRNWIAPLETLLANNQTALVIVGTAHLVGEGSVVDLLEQQGYSIERVQ